MRLNTHFSVVAAVLLAYASPVWAATPEVRDEASFFKPETITAANAIIGKIKDENKLNLFIETFSHVPADKEKEAADRDTAAAFFTEWANQRARELQLDGGIYVLICKEPPYIKVATGARAREVFPNADRDQLDKLLVASFRNKKYDDGLLEGLRYVQSALKGKDAGSGVSAHNSGGVRDQAGFFKPDAITKADEIISAIKRDDKKDLVVETFLHAPEGKQQEAANPDTKADFFKEWADERGREQKVNGVYVLVCKAPPYLKVVADNRTAKIFDEEARNHLSNLLAMRFKSKDYDNGLLEGVRYVQTMLKGKAANDPASSAADPAPAPPWPTSGETGGQTRRGGGGGIPGGGMAIGGLLCVGLVLLVVVGVVVMVAMAVARAFHRGPVGYGPGGYGPAGPGGYGGGYGGGMGGGGFFSSMLGSLFGSAAGSWGYNQFFGGHQGQSHGSFPREDGMSPPPQRDTGYTSGGGGDFGGGGDTGGGADFGGGGDFGGGDTGGGGDFGGGGDTGGGGSF